MKALLVALLAITSPIPAPGWGHYTNQLYGYGIDVPPGLIGRGEAGNGDGQDFTSPTITLMVRAEPTPDGFEASIRDWRAWESKQGWNMVFEMVTPTQASVSAKRPGWLMEMRAITLCGDAVAKFQLEYMTAEAAAMQPVIARLAASLEQTRKC